MSQYIHLQQMVKGTSSSSFGEHNHLWITSSCYSISWKLKKRWFNDNLSRVGEPANTCLAFWQAVRLMLLVMFDSKDPVLSRLSVGIPISDQGNRQLKVVVQKTMHYKIQVLLHAIYCAYHYLLPSFIDTKHSQTVTTATSVPRGSKIKSQCRLWLYQAHHSLAQPPANADTVPCNMSWLFSYTTFSTITVPVL